jgi:hypothetical protein
MMEYYKGGIRYGRPGFGIWIPVWMPIVLVVAVAAAWLLWETLADWTCCGMAVF